jgi:starvation-inducible DNA-binding protein
MEELIQQMKVSLASVFSLYLKSHNYHWNVTGPNFAQYHEYFGDMYEELFDTIDMYAEEIRKLDAFAPGSLSRFDSLSVIEDELNVPQASEMFRRLRDDNLKVIQVLTTANDMAEQNNKIGLANFLQDRIQYHDKLNWMLSSFIK